MKTNFITVKIFLFLSIINLSFTTKCTEAEFEEIQSNKIKELIISSDNDACLKYSLKSTKNLIALNFEIGNIYSGHVYIYKSKSDISFVDNQYQNSIIDYSIGEYSFKDFDVSEFEDTVYIIIAETKSYYFTDYLTLYDSENVIGAKNGEPITLKNFMSNSKYLIQYIAKKPFEMFLNSKIYGHKKITTQLNDKTDEPVIDENGIHKSIKVEEEKESIYLVTIELIDDIKDQEFSIIFYEGNLINTEAEELIQNQLIKKEYIAFNNTNNETKNFYFFTDVSNFTNSGTVNLKIDYLYNSTDYIVINSDLVISDKLLDKNDLQPYFDAIEGKNNLLIDYDLDSDEYKNIYFKNNEENKYKYVIIIIKLKKFIFYHSPRQFTISIGDEIKNIDLEGIDYFNTYTINIDTNSYIPSYFKIKLDKDSKYILYAPYEINQLLIKGDLLTEDNQINKNYLIDGKDMIILSDLNELTVRLLGYKIDKATFYVEKINDDVIIVENDRKKEAITITMTQEECDSENKKYILGTYNKDIYTIQKDTLYGIGDLNTDFNLFYKNDLTKDNDSLFPSSTDYQKKLEEVFILDKDIDFFTITCKKGGDFSIRPVTKNFDETIHIINESSINNITLLDEKEILQLSSPIKRNHEPLYLSILSTKGNEIKITPDTKELFEEQTIKDNELFIKTIDTDKFRMDQLAIKVTASEGTNIEVIEVIHQEYMKYIEINDTNKHEITNNNFVIFINKTIDKININIDGLENSEKVFYGIVKLSTNNINYIPPAYLFNDMESKNMNKNELIEINNKYYNKDDEQKKFQALIFSINTTETNKKYNVQITESKGNKDNDANKDEDNMLKMILLIVGLLVILIVIIIVILHFKKKNGSENIENIDSNNQQFLSIGAGEE